MNQKKKKIEEYQPGDVIRGTFYTRNISHKKREHTLIVLNEVRGISESKPHIPCIPSCSFSSHAPLNNKFPTLNLSGYDVPANFFDNKKSTSFLRFSEPVCLKKFEIKEYKGNLKQFEGLWASICDLINSSFPNSIHLMEELCECSCLVAQNINVGYCDQDEEECLFISSVVCSCCCAPIETDKIQYILCPHCNDNLYVTITDENGDTISEIYPN